jgi:hypothetical protein
MSHYVFGLGQLENYQTGVNLWQKVRLLEAMPPNSLLLYWLSTSLPGCQNGCCTVQTALLWPHVAKSETIRSHSTKCTAARLITIFCMGLKMDVVMCKQFSFVHIGHVMLCHEPWLVRNLAITGQTMTKSETVRSHATKCTAAID